MVPTPSVWKVRRAGENALRRNQGWFASGIHFRSAFGLGHVSAYVYCPSRFALKKLGVTDLAWHAHQRLHRLRTECEGASNLPSSPSQEREKL